MPSLYRACQDRPLSRYSWFKNLKGSLDISLKWDYISLVWDDLVATLYTQNHWGTVMSEARRKIDEINYEFNRANTLYSQWAQKQNLNLYTLLVYYMLHSYGSLSQKQVSDSLKMPKQTVNHVIKAMSNDGHISLVTDDSDKRSKKIEFTDKGIAYATELLTPLITIEEKVFERLGEGRFQLIIEATKAYGDILQEEMDKLD